MTERQRQICSLLTKHARPVILLHYRPDSCIASTKVAIKVLSHFKIPAYPQTFRVSIMNQKYNELFEQCGRHPTEEESELWKSAGAHQIIICGELEHVVAIADDELIVDLSLDQASRPEKGIRLEPSVCGLPKEWKTRAALEYEGNGMILSYMKVESQLFRKSRDWSVGTRTDDIVQDVIKRINKELKHGFRA